MMTPFFGACWYPDHWDRADWPRHIRLMKEAHMNVIRTADFSWARLEPEKGRFDFSWLDDALNLLNDNGIQVILCTPTAAPPRWLDKEADILQRDRYGHKRAWGSRRECCANNEAYRQAAARIVEKMAEHYASFPNVAAWQIDNEFGCQNSALCYCESCRRAFSRYLKNKYQTPEAWNRAWGDAFWSLHYDSFDDAILPIYNACEPETSHDWSHNPALDLDFRRFSSDSWTDFQQMQIDILRRYTDKPVTHNLMGQYSGLDYYKLARNLDFAEWDNYPETQWGSASWENVSMAHEIMRGVKNKPFLVAEEQSGPCGWDHMGAAPEPGQIRLWTHQAIAHGASGILYFRFKALHYGMEQYWYGILDHDGVPRRRYYEVQEVGREIQKLGDPILSSRPLYDALILRDYENGWSHEIRSHADNFRYDTLLNAYYQANADLHIQTAVSMGPLDGFKVVYAPALDMVSEEMLREITAYVQNGGTLAVTFRSGTRNQYCGMRTDTLPGAFRELAGIEVEEFDPLRRETHVEGLVSSACRVWCDLIRPVTAQPLCVYADRWFKGVPAVTVNRYGKGKVYYIGCDLEPNALKDLVLHISRDAGIAMLPEIHGVEIVRRENCTILLNHLPTPVQTNIQGTSLLTDQPFTGLLPAYGAEYLALPPVQA